MGAKWFHVTRTWLEPRVWVQPQGVRADDEHDPRDLEPCICVSPSIAQCLVAVGDWQDYDTLRVYQTTGTPRPAPWVFDYQVTQEHRFYTSKRFSFVREFTPRDLIVAMMDFVEPGDREALESLDCLPFLRYKLNIYKQVLSS